MGTLLVVLVIVATSLAYPQYEGVNNGDVKQSTFLEDLNQGEGSEDTNKGRSIGDISPDDRVQNVLNFLLDSSLVNATDHTKTEPNKIVGGPFSPSKLCEKGECTQQCTDHEECVEQKFCKPRRELLILKEIFPSLDLSSGLKTCYLPSGGNGVCCTLGPTPYLADCRDNSFCTSASSCFGQFLNSNNEFVDYVKTESWTECSYGLETGVCCLNRENAASNLKPATECGIRNYNINETTTTSKYGPDEAAFGEFPWQAILAYQNFTIFCAATLVSRKHVVTAARCVDKVDLSNVIVRLGQWHINNTNPGVRYDVGVLKMSKRSSFCPNDLRDDIAVLELYEPIEYHYHINSVCLPQSNIIQPNSKCFATGYSFDGQNNNILKKFELSYVDQETCQNRLRKTLLKKYFLLDKSFVCAGGEENKNACFVDIGGPLVCKDEFTSRYILIGVDSWGNGCNAKNAPGVYTNVPLFYDAINDLINEKFQIYNPDYLDQHPELRIQYQPPYLPKPYGQQPVTPKSNDQLSQDKQPTTPQPQPYESFNEDQQPK